MKSLLLMMAIILLSTGTSFAQIKNSKTDTIKIYGNCEMCKAKIEKAGTQKNISKTVWSEETNMATITYDAAKTNTDAILKKIALVGYDSESFLAPNAVYAKLPGCCKYERKAKPSIKDNGQMTVLTKDNNESNANPPHVIAANEVVRYVDTVNEQKQLKDIYNNYFDVKEALIKTDANAAAVNATTLLASLNAINMAIMKMDDHMAFMKVEKTLKADATSISNSKDITAQRTAFSNLSTNMVAFIKVTKTVEPVYLQHCPMYNDGKGADWLSKESTIKNPYYGSMMLTCGKTVETIK